MARDAIMTALGEQVDCYRRLAKLAEAQHEHVQQSDAEGLLDVLGRRQEVLDQIQTLERTLAPAKRAWGEYAAGLDAESRASAEEMLSEVKRLLGQITTADRNDAMVLQQRKLNVGREINQAAAARQVNRRYAVAAYGARQTSMDMHR